MSKNNKPIVTSHVNNAVTKSDSISKLKQDLKNANKSHYIRNKINYLSLESSSPPFYYVLALSIFSL